MSKVFSKKLEQACKTSFSLLVVRVETRLSSHRNTVLSDAKKVTEMRAGPKWRPGENATPRAGSELHEKDGY